MGEQRRVRVREVTHVLVCGQRHVRMREVTRALMCMQTRAWTCVQTRGLGCVRTHDSMCSKGAVRGGRKGCFARVWRRWTWADRRAF